MGQTAFGCLNVIDSCSDKANSLSVAIAHHVLDAENPFGEIDVANCAMIRAAKDGDLCGIKHALEAGADINTHVPIWIRVGSAHDDVDESACSRDRDAEWVDVEPAALLGSGFTPLMHASQEGHYKAVKLLLKLGANVHIRDIDGMQALHLAAQSGSTECFRALIEAGSDPLMLDEFDRTAIECAPSGEAKHACLAIFEEHAGMSPQVVETTEAGYDAAPRWTARQDSCVEMDSDSTASKETTAEQNSENFAMGCDVDAYVLSKRNTSVDSESTEASLEYCSWRESAAIVA